MSTLEKIKSLTSEEVRSISIFQASNCVLMKSIRRVAHGGEFSRLTTLWKQVASEAAEVGIDLDPLEDQGEIEEAITALYEKSGVC